WAAYGGHVKLVKLLLKRKAPVNTKDESYRGTPLGWALYGWGYPPPEANRAAYYEIVALLVAAGATVEPAWLAKRGPLDKQVRADARMRAALADARPVPSINDSARWIASTDRRVQRSARTSRAV